MRAGLKNEAQLWLHIATGGIPLRPACAEADQRHKERGPAFTNSSASSDTGAVVAYREGSRAPFCVARVSHSSRTNARSFSIDRESFTCTVELARLPT